MEENRRQHFRIPYQIGKAPIFRCEQGTFKVLDISEFGIRLEISKKYRFDFLKTQKIAGEIVFPGGRAKQKIKGSIIRNENFQVAIFLEKEASIPLPRIMQEQIQLIKEGQLAIA